ncbi:hypothetical protein F443_09317 [Phytophthora nicotianae P1569]|uniref:Uncharacterized protein n=1 Tax=Phytophthora nicotianae P1569 TaxID=1317065 RepID=V9F7B6_PHYNI|nr:hypothetical protein F443_09317 [Phytophthora nicotianae P1569]
MSPTAVDLVCRSKSELDGITYVVDAISAYADSSVELPLAKACTFGSLRLLNRIWNSTIDLESNGRGMWSIRKLLRSYKLYGKLQFTLCLLEAVKINSLEIVQWLFERFPDYGVRRPVVYGAAEAGALEILQYFREHGTTVNHEDEENLEGGRWNEETENWEKGRWVYWGNEDAAQAALGGHQDAVMYIYETTAYEDRCDYDTIGGAIIRGDLELAEWLSDRLDMLPDGPDAHLGAAANGHVRSLQWLHARGQYSMYDVGVLVRAAEAGHLDVVRWIIDRDWNDQGLGTDSGEDEDEYAMGYNRGNRTRRTHITCLGGEASLAIHAAAIHGHLDVAKYLHSRIDIPLDAIDRVKEDWRLYKRLKAISRQIGQNNNAAKVSGVTMLLAAQRGHADVVQWLYEEYHGDPRINLFWVYSDAEAKYVSVVDAAAANGHLEIVKYLLQVGKEGNDSVGPPQKRQRTQESSNFTVREDMHDTHSELLDDPTMPSCTKKAIDNAAAAGHLDVVKWLHVNRTDGCTTDAMDLAALNGHLEVVQWLDANRNEGCTTGAMDNAATSGELAVVKWLHEHRTEGCTLAAMNGAASNGFLIVVKWLHDNRSEGCSSAAMNGAAARGALDAVKWLHHHRSESCTPLAMDEAARKGHLHVLRWLFENRDEGFTTVAVSNAAQAGHFETVLILHNLAQEGLVPEVEKMNEDASMVLISDIYQEVVRAVLPKTDE